MKPSHMLRLGALLTLLLLSLAAPGMSRAAPLAYEPGELSYGLYWFGYDGANQKAVPGEANAYFDPTQPTVIFAHGWQPFISDVIPNFDDAEPMGSGGTDTAAGWIDAGWNIGIFVWNQFSDERTGVLAAGGWFADGPPPQGVLDAEAKIWTAAGPQGMRWYDWDANFGLGDYSDAPPGTPSAGQLFYDAYVAAFPETYTQTIRVAGHSLGNQMAVRLTKLVHDGIAAGEVGEHLRPSRVALLDPYWSPDPRDYLDDQRTGDVVRATIAALIPTGTLFEWYHSSDWTTPPQADANDALQPMLLYAQMRPIYAADDLEAHMAAQHLYFGSYAFDGPAPCAGAACLTMDTLLARMSDDQLASVSRSDYLWTQDGGSSSATPEDDTYRSGRRPDAPYRVAALQADPPMQEAGKWVTVTASVVDNADDPVGDGVIVSFSAILGILSPRAVTRDGVAVAQLTASTAAVIDVEATTKGAEGTVEQTLPVTFTLAGCTPLVDVAIGDPEELSGTLYVDGLYTFPARPTPQDATAPITYTWTPTPTNGQHVDRARYRWETPGTYTLTLTAENCGGIRTTQRIFVVEPRPAGCTPLTAVAIVGPQSVTGTFQVDTFYTFDAVTTPTWASTPITYTWTPTPTTGQGTAPVTYRWETPGTYTLTLTTENCAPPVTAPPFVLDVTAGTKIYLPLVLRQ